jgi:phospholipase C
MLAIVRLLRPASFDSQMHSATVLTCVLLGALGLSGCGGASGATTTPAAVAKAATVGEIDHVVIIVQENRSFDNLFHGFPGTDSATYGLRHDGTKAVLQPTGFEAALDIDHTMASFLAAYHGGKMDGFDQEFGGANPHSIPYAYVPQSETKPYWDLARQYVLADRMFPSQLDESYTAHQFLIAAQAGGVVDAPNAAPWGCDAPAGTIIHEMTPARAWGTGVFPCFAYRTLGDELDDRGLPWTYYAPNLYADVGGLAWTAYDAIKGIRHGPDWKKNIVWPETKVIGDVAAGKLGAVTWVVPDWINSDHSGNDSTTGPAWVASVVNAIGASPLWRSTAIFIVWDDWGGWYDHVPPPQVDLFGLGIRVPLIVVSPYAKSGYVSHVQYEFGSILQFAETRFDLAPLAAADARANPLDDCFDFNQPPRRFTAIATRRSVSDLLSRPPSGRAPDSD